MRSFFTSSLLAALLISSGLSAVEPYESLRVLPHESYSLENGYILLEKVRATTPLFFVDVGSPKGEAARFIASNFADTSSAEGLTVFAIHSWSRGQYHQVLSDILHEQLEGRVNVLRMSSAEASNALDVSAGVIFLDSSNSDTLHDNILLWLTQLADNGVIAGNHWQSSSVAVAVVNAAAQLNLILSNNGNYWFLTRP